MKKKAEQLKKAVKENNERGARIGVIEDMFQDFNRSRVQVYKMNFVRGIFFGFGSALGGTVVVALIVWLMTMAAQNFPPLQDFMNNVNQAVQNAARDSSQQ